MKRTAPLPLLGLLLLAVSASSARGDEAWTSDYKAAQAKAKETKRALLLDFTGSDWCRPCMALHKEVFATKEFAAIAEGLVLVELDFPQRTKLSDALAAQNKALQERYKVKGFPTAILVDHEGTEIGRIGGYQAGKGERWLAEAKELLSAGFSAETGKAKPKPEPKGGVYTPGTWSTSWDQAQEAARKLKRPILVNFTGSDWCGWCIKLHKEVFDEGAFKEWAAKRVVLLELDFPSRTPQPKELKEQNARLSQKYDVQGFPTILFLDAEGEVLGQSGYLPGGPKAWLADAEKTLGATK